jgi:RNA polymerase sigma-70 factor (ECF subfamily)
VTDDDELIASLAGGDDTALRQLFDRHAPWLAARLRKALPPDDVEDVLQETFLAVWKNAATYRPRGTPAAWLWGIARNQAALLLRKRPAIPSLLEAGGPVSDLAEAAATRTDLDVAAAAALGPRGCALQLAATGASVPGGILMLARNVTGITGIGLLASPVTGGLLAWIPPFGYVGFSEYALTAAWRSPWTWPVRPPADRGAWICAVLVFAAGLAAVTFRGARTSLAGNG